MQTLPPCPLERGSPLGPAHPRRGYLVYLLFSGNRPNRFNRSHSRPKTMSVVHWPCGALSSAIVILAQILVVTAVLANRTIDDQLGDSVTGAVPSHTPDEGWTTGQTCPGCGIHPGEVDPDKTFQGTWTDSTYHPGQPDRVIMASFAGTAVYVYNLIANSFPYITTETNMSFSIDGTYMGQYTHLPDSSQTILYDICVFSTSNLANKPHTLEMRANGPTASLILFDYIIYTVDEPITSDSPAPPAKSPTAVITSSTVPITSSTTTQISSSSTSIHTTLSPSSASSSMTTRFGTASIPSQAGSGPESNANAQSTNISSGSDPTSAATSGSSATQGSSVPSDVGSTRDSSSHSVPVGAIAGGVAGGSLLVALAVALAITLLCRRRRRSQASKRSAWSTGNNAGDRTPHSRRLGLSSDQTLLRHRPAFPRSGQAHPGSTVGFGGEKSLSSEAPSDPTLVNSAQSHPITNAIPLDSTEPEQAAGGPLPGAAGDETEAQVGTDTPELILRHVQALWQELRRLRGGDVESPTEDLPPGYDQLSER
ncbi:hypothetical protein FKP32DRAFT_1633776 [Trametes sanguinea]|nr:hypothetical protein FKP32DRAFT_1633776 [Trametes sanguinea]